MSRIVYKSNGQGIGDGIRVTRISEDGQKLEVLVDNDPDAPRYSEVILKADPPETQPEVQPAAQPDILDVVQETAATFVAGFTEITQEGGTLKAEIRREGTVGEIAKLTYGVYVKVNGIVMLRKSWPTDEEGTDATKVIGWAPGDKIELHTWMNSPAGQQMRVNKFTVPGTPEAPQTA